ncbi:phospholipase C delta isoform [Apostichopus japonicus]|uniref:Phosphoinositide phospholipase C n=1 Tax=Stichopus japonicus TaxID=307972 RepID=A0A2G8LGH3_STIJA|nr:phospholipase C delta isoform [Apostichopus japonicus]
MLRIALTEKLKNKILVKGKKLPAFDSTTQGGDVSDEDEAGDMEDVERREVQKQLKENKEKKAKTIKLAKEFSDTVYLSSKHFNGIEEEMGARKPFEMSSFTESKALDLAKKSGQEFARYNSLFLSRMYPAGWRTNSSNYDPIPMWNVGAQIDRRRGNGCLQRALFGKWKLRLRLKPDFMLAENNNSVKREQPFHLTVLIISGQQLPTSSSDVTDPYVKVTMYGTDVTIEHKTEVVKNNGFNPVWKCQMSFDVQVPELSVMRFEVRDRDVGSKDDLQAQYSLPVMCMQEGYHHVMLRSPEGNELSSSTLFVHVSKTRAKRTSMEDENGG